MSFVKPEVHNVSKPRQRKSIGEFRQRGFRVMRADRQTDTQT